MQSALLDKLTNCAEVSDRDARLACFEAAAAALKVAAQRGEVVIIDREQAREVRRQAFGFTLPSLGLFDRGERRDPIDRVSGRLADASRDAAGRWTFRLQDGATWTQVDGDIVTVRPRPGLAVDVRKGAVGGYFLSLDGHAGVRVRRVQ